MRSASKAAAALAMVACVACVAWSAPARAESTDPSYGRIEGDVTLVVGAGAVAATGGPRLEGELRARYLEMAGIFAAYEDGLALGSSVEPRRLIAAGLELRPLFMFRWLRGHETHDAPFDLMVDSLGLELGAVFAEGVGGGGFTSHPGLQVGVGIEAPIMLHATGLWVGVHGGVRWSDAALASGVVAGAEDREGYVAVTLAWHEVVTAHLVDAMDRAPR